MENEAKWYVIHVYSGHEKKVEANIKKMIENRGMQDQIVDTCIPYEESVETEGSRPSQRKLCPQYVFVKMIMSDDAWHAVKSIRGVTGFVGPESKPVPLTDSEITNMKIEKVSVRVDFEVGDTVRVTDGPLSGYLGKVQELDAQKGKVKLFVDLFMGRETEVDLELNQVEPIS